MLLAYPIEKALSTRGNHMEQELRKSIAAEKAKLKDVRKFNNAAKTFLKNDAKWKAAKQWCELHNMEFYIWTEKELKNMGLL